MSSSTDEMLMEQQTIIMQQQAFIAQLLQQQQQPAYYGYTDPYFLAETDLQLMVPQKCSSVAKDPGPNATAEGGIF